MTAIDDIISTVQKDLKRHDSNKYRRKTKRYRYEMIRGEKHMSADERIKDIKALGMAQDINLKKDTLKKLFILLIIETIIVFSFTFLQATKFLNFNLEEWSFKLLISATILQITFMIHVAVKHLFPDKSAPA